LYQPEGARISKPRSLVVFLHGGNGSADVIYDHISLRQKAPTFNLSGDPERLGFFLLSIHGRNVHYPTFNPRDGRHHDFYFRDMGSPSTNPDITNVDYWIDTLVATGKVDTKRIYLAGWSNGGYFSQMYAIARHENATPGGARVAAAVAYTAADPFNNINRDQRPSCKLDPYPESTVPLMLVHRSCDIVACDVVQALSFEEAGSEVEPGHIVGPWVRSLAVSVKNPHVRQLIVDTDGEAVNQCRRLGCTPSIGILNHVRWPDGVADRSGIDHEPAMLDFMRAHPLG
jgi:poly(3-hydroxybutyrate) depolymerase